MEGAEFEIIAAEDIYTQEVLKDLFGSYSVNPETYLVYKKGDVAAKITTDRNGWGYASGLYIGKYKIVETTAGDGFVLNTKETEFEISAKKQTVNFDFHTVDYKDRSWKLPRKSGIRTAEGRLPKRYTVCMPGRISQRISSSMKIPESGS